MSVSKEEEMLIEAQEQIQALQKENVELRETKEERVIQRAYLIECNTLEERSSEASHYNWLDDENERLEKENEELVEILKACTSFMKGKTSAVDLIEKNQATIDRLLGGEK